MAKKLSVLNSMLSKFNDLMGDGVVHTAATLPKCRKILSRIPAYNYVTCGGFPIGRVIEHYGENGSLKSYASYDAIAKFQHYDWANHEPNAFKSFTYKGDDTMRELESFELRDGYKPKNHLWHEELPLWILRLPTLPTGEKISVLTMRVLFW